MNLLLTLQASPMKEMYLQRNCLKRLYIYIYPNKIPSLKQCYCIHTRHSIIQCLHSKSSAWRIEFATNMDLKNMAVTSEFKNIQVSSWKTRRESFESFTKMIFARKISILKV